jgi:hypothetical protein
MANKKISSLTELAVAVADDLIPIVDTLTTETKKIKVGNLINSLPINKSLPPGCVNIYEYNALKFANLCHSSPGILRIIEPLPCTTSS